MLFFITAILVLILFKFINFLNLGKSTWICFCCSCIRMFRCLGFSVACLMHRLAVLQVCTSLCHVAQEVTNKSSSSQDLTIIMGCLFLHNTGKYYVDKLHFILFYGTKIFYLKKWYKWKNLSGCFSATYRKDKVIGFRYIFKIYFLNNFTSSVFISFLLLSLSLSNLPVSPSPSQFLTSTSTVNTVTYVHIHITK